jgi:hypothetical protein
MSDSEFVLSKQAAIGAVAGALSAKFRAIDYISDVDARFYCKHGKHYLQKTEVKFRKNDGQLICGEHGYKINVLRRERGRYKVATDEVSGVTELCCKPWLPCKLRFPVVNHLAVGVLRKRVLCMGVKCELIDAPKKYAKQNNVVLNGTFQEVKQ